MKLITALTGYTFDTYPFVVLEINNSIYLFNLPDCCCRIFYDSSYSITRAKHIFLSSCCLEDSGGFLGSLIAILKPWKTKVEVTCPKSVQQLIMHNEYFSKMPNENLPILSEDIYSDDLITVTPIFTGQSMSFSVQCKDIPGRFLPEKAKKLGIKPGPNFSKLKKGEILTNEKGEAVKLADCISEPIRGERILFVNIKNEEDIKTIESIEKLNEYDIIVHMTPIRIVNKNEYLNKFRYEESVKHICFGFSGKISYKTVSNLYQKFVDHSNGMLKPISTCETLNDLPGNFISLSTGDSNVFSPSQKVAVFRDIENMHSNYNCPLPLFQSFAVTFLGTGAANPTRCRSAPGILIHTKYGFIALDVGEGFVGQLFRKYGIENAKFILKNLKLIFISHPHSDHYFGLHCLLRIRSLFTQEKVQLYCESTIYEEMTFFESLYKNESFNIVHIDPRVSQLAVADMNNSVNMKTVSVYHTNNSKGCLITIDNKYRIAYSGDRKARSDDHFVEEFGEVDLLIHEGTFSYELDTEMDNYDHSTVNHAIEVQKKMNAKYMAIVHSSFKYDSKFIPCPYEKAFITFDYLSFSFDDIEKVLKMVRRVNQECLKPA